MAYRPPVNGTTIYYTPTAVFGDSVNASSVAASTVTYIRVPYTGTIAAWHIVANTSCSCTIDVWKANNAVPTVANTITASAKPSLSSASTGSSTSLTGWTTSVGAGDVLAFKLESLTGSPNAITLVLRVTGS